MVPKFSLSKLRAGSRIAVIGGGPAGSAFALSALHFARQAGLDLQVTLFEPRDFSRPGPWGCNMCAGLVPVRALQQLAEIGVTVPSHVIREHISHYTLHTIAGQICLPQPDPDGDVVSVYRGNGPRCGTSWPECISFDSFLLDTARSRGAEIVRDRATTVTLDPRPFVETKRNRFPAELVVLAAGVNRRSIHFTDLPYQPPPRRKMAQTELCLGTDAVRSTLGNSVHILLPKDDSLEFGTLVPKGPCVNVSLLGEDLPSGSIARFLALPEVAALLPPDLPRACGCRPRIAMGPAQPLYSDRFAAVGDAGITRLYKNGIGTALRTARRAAYTAVHHGVSAADFHANYGPLCREIAWDNRAGRFLFAFTRVFQHHLWLTRPHLRAIAAEQTLPPAERLHSRFLWGMFTGTYPYSRLLAMACRPSVHLRLLRCLLGEAANGEQPRGIGDRLPELTGLSPPRGFSTWIDLN